MGVGAKQGGGMASVRIVLYSAVLCLVSASSCHHYGDWGCSPRSRHVVSRGHHHHHYEAPVVQKRVHVTHEVHHIVHKRRRRPRPVIHVVEEARPEVVYVEDTRPDVVVVDQPAVVAPVAPVAPAAAVAPSAYAPPYGTGSIDPRLVPVLRGSSPQQGDPLGIYPGGGLDPRIDPSLVPAARGQLEDQVRVLKDQLDVLTRRLGVPLNGGNSRTAEDL